MKKKHPVLKNILSYFLYFVIGACIYFIMKYIIFHLLLFSFYSKESMAFEKGPWQCLFVPG